MIINNVYIMFTPHYTITTLSIPVNKHIVILQILLFIVIGVSICIYCL